MAISPSEEIDLLIKWLGNISKRHALSKKAAYVKTPPVELSKIWDRLDERYGTDECVYYAIV